MVTLLVSHQRVVDDRERAQPLGCRRAQDSRGDDRDARRVEPSAHEHAKRLRSHTIGHGNSEQLTDLIDVLARIGIADRVTRFEAQ